MTIVDVHTHMLSAAWLELLREHGLPHHSVRPTIGGEEAIHFQGAPFMTLTPAMFDYATRIAAMDEVGVDVAIVSLTCPNVFWGSPDISSRAAALVNDSMAEAQHEWPDRLRYLCSLPWLHPSLACAELDRACDRGAVGVLVLANIAGRALVDPLFEPIWTAIERRGLPVLVHPTAPPGTFALDLTDYNLVASIGFTFDTTLAISRMVFDGFFDRHPDLSVIAAHGGGTLPYVVGRLDRCHEQMPACRVRTDRRPSEYLRNLYYDAVVYEPEALHACLALAGADRVLYGSDYPHNIGDMRGCLDRVEALGTRARAKVRGANALKLFGL